MVRKHSNHTEKRRPGRQERSSNGNNCNKEDSSDVTVMMTVAVLTSALPLVAAVMMMYASLK
eukprot:11755561-Ditylum_brightwellii.AAC.1